MSYLLHIYTNFAQINQNCTSPSPADTWPCNKVVLNDKLQAHITLLQHCNHAMCLLGQLSLDLIIISRPQCNVTVSAHTKMWKKMYDPTTFI